MTDFEFNEFYDRKKKEAIEATLGHGKKYKIPENAHTKFVVSGKDCEKWNSASRGMLSGLAYEQSMKWLGEYNKMKYYNGGKIVTYVDESPSEIPPVVK